MVVIVIDVVNVIAIVTFVMGVATVVDAIVMDVTVVDVIVMDATVEGVKKSVEEYPPVFLVVLQAFSNCVESILKVSQQNQVLFDFLFVFVILFN